MTKRSTSLNGNIGPFLLKPCGKDYIWGGNRLNDDFSKNIDLSPLAETWECSTHPDGVSVVDSGKHKGRFLNEVLKENPQYMGIHKNIDGELPILIKFIDAKKDLSVQVHPSDEYAKEHENGSLGKTEMWYIIDADSDAKLVYGFNREIDKETLKNSLEKGDVEKYLQKVNVKSDDIFYIEAGTVHAIGKGALVAEIQENSNITYRMYDYNRVDKNGKLRQLHTEKALDVANLKGSAEPKQPLRLLKYTPGSASEFLCRCKYFQVERLLVNTERCKSMVSFFADETSFQVLLCIDGCGSLTYAEKDHLNFFKGDCIFVPANCKHIKIHGKTKFLKVTC